MPTNNIPEQHAHEGTVNNMHSIQEARYLGPYISLCLSIIILTRYMYTDM